MPPSSVSSITRERVASTSATPNTRPKGSAMKRVVAVTMAQTSNQEYLRDFENMVMQAVVGNGTLVTAGTN